MCVVCVCSVYGVFVCVEGGRGECMCGVECVVLVCERRDNRLERCGGKRMSARTIQKINKKINKKNKYSGAHIPYYEMKK